VLKSLSIEDAAGLVEDLPESQAARLIERLSATQAAKIVSELPSDEQADVIGRMSIADAKAILNEMTSDAAFDAQRLMAYPSDVAGGLMITELLSYRQDLTVGDVLDDLRAHGDLYRSYDVQYAYVVSNA